MQNVKNTLLIEVLESLLLPLWHSQKDIITWMMSMKGYHYFLCGEVSQINKHAGTVFVLFILYKFLRTEGGCPKGFVKFLSATLLKNSPQTIHHFSPISYFYLMCFVFNSSETLGIASVHLLLRKAWKQDKWFVCMAVLGIPWLISMIQNWLQLDFLSAFSRSQRLFLSSQRWSFPPQSCSLT